MQLSGYQGSVIIAWQSHGGTCNDDDARNVKAVSPSANKQVALLAGWFGYCDKANDTDRYGHDSDELEVKYPWPARVLDEDRSDN